jgi:hypothetical protein
MSHRVESRLYLITEILPGKEEVESVVQILRSRGGLSRAMEKRVSVD